MKKIQMFTMLLGVMNLKLGSFRGLINVADYQDGGDLDRLIDSLGDIQIFGTGRLIKAGHLVDSKRIMTIVDQYKKGLHLLPYNYATEVEFVVEEALEVLGYESEEARVEAKKYVANMPQEEVIIKGGKMETLRMLRKAEKAVESLGYDNNKVLLEVERQNNSRVGEVVDGKFVKDTTQEALANYYVPDFNNAKIM